MNTKSIPRPEHPRPDMRRDTWLNLNGEWEYRSDPTGAAINKGALEGRYYRETITVPFCRESRLSGIGDTDFCHRCWYKKTMTLPEGWNKNGNRIRLHIGACDYETDVWVNGKHVGNHIGGYISFAFDITDALDGDEMTLIIRAFDDTRDIRQSTGKQTANTYRSIGCYYTRTTGIWQTVWLELVPAAHITGMKLYPNIETGVLHAELTAKNAFGKRIRAAASYKGKPVGEAEAKVVNGLCMLDIKLSELHLWDVGKGELYDIDFTMDEDTVHSYFGMREVDCKDGILYLNGRPVFQRLVLDQGFYPDGIYTAKDLAELYHDVDLSMSMGFNGARLHEKVFEPLFLEYCDRMGYLVWGEYPNWGMPADDDVNYSNMMQEWQEIVLRDFNHPSIIGWCPLNEACEDHPHRLLEKLAEATRNLDHTRLYIDASGWYHTVGVTDIWDAHDYNHIPEDFKKQYDSLAEGARFNIHFRASSEKTECWEMPTFLSEFGGIWWKPDAEEGWGMGCPVPESEEAFRVRFRGLIEALLFNPIMGGYCYTQLYDVEQEMNGLCFYDRTPKVAPDFFREVQIQKAKIEE